MTRAAEKTGAAKTDRAFAKLVDTLVADDGAVTPPDPSRGAFGSNALRVDGKIFAMLVRGELVLKLPRAQVDHLASAGHGVPFDAGKGRPMKEWVVVRAPERTWLALAREAHAFVKGAKKTRRKPAQKPPKKPR
jgi:TfoX/Sxy family transcriptional regulator of competence genes